MEKLLIMSNFSFSHNAFYLFGELFAFFVKCGFDVWTLFQFGRVLKFVVWERVKTVENYLEILKFWVAAHIPIVIQLLAPSLLVFQKKFALKSFK